ncbi:hypothetical protein Sango_1242900 [Sesamum angolense]|uniref:Uncharacterized protein n=1 Tax=Sesamum angolense TaxID=2727404 RepID=A0AAE1WQJ8_9LAMI|nr:hypothetical protein Sango_1242900 [Sesamum angolense]
MIELTSSHQWEEKLVIDYINRWRNLSLNYKNRLSETSTIEICIRNALGFLLHLQGIKPNLFEELATRAHAFEITMDLDGREQLSDDIDDDGQENDEEYIASY